MPPPGEGLITDIWAAPGKANWSAGTAALSSVLLMTVVARFMPFHCRTDAATKSVPFTMSWNPGHPAGTDGSKAETKVGVGLLVNRVMVNVRWLDRPAAGSGFATETVKDRAAARSLAESVVSICVPVCDVIGRGMPFRRRVAPLVKPEPFTAKSTGAAPAMALSGEREAI